MEKTHKSAYPIMKDSLHTNDTETLYERLRVESPRPGAGHRAEEALERLMTRIHADAMPHLKLLHDRTRRYRIWLAAASTAVVFLSAGWLSAVLRPEAEMRVHSNNWEKVCNLTLEDGTHLTLNRGAQLIYPDRFTGDQREIFLTGEAYFDVAHDSKHPFVVRVGDLSIKVLGTKFNIESYPDSETITTTLLEGSVEVESQLSHRSVRMIPNQQLSYNTRSGEMQLNTLTESEESIRWTDNIWVLHQTPFLEVCKRLERQFHIKVVILNDALVEKNFTGEFHFDDSLESILEVIRITTPFNYELKEETLILK